MSNFCSDTTLSTCGQWASLAGGARAYRIVSCPDICPRLSRQQQTKTISSCSSIYIQAVVDGEAARSLGVVLTMPQWNSSITHNVVRKWWRCFVRFSSPTRPLNELCVFNVHLLFRPFETCLKHTHTRELLTCDWTIVWSLLLTIPNESYMNRYESIRQNKADWTT